MPFWKKKPKPSTIEPEVTSQEPSDLQLKSNSTDQDLSTPFKNNSWFKRLSSGLSRTRQSFGSGLHKLLKGQIKIAPEHLEDIETHLLQADVGLEVTEHLTETITQNAKQPEPQELITLLKGELENILTPCHQPLTISNQKSPFVILMVGVNGAGKTTTIGKLANLYQNLGHKVMLAAGDTFRAAAVEQLQAWGQRLSVPVIAQPQGADSASVIYDALTSAKAKNTDIIIADTAGRLHNKQNLMQELQKIVRVIQKFDPDAPHETCLVLDAGTGQNALMQTEQFNQTAPLSSLILTKLDGTAKGGIVFALCQRFQLPIRFIGVGEGLDDLQPFDPKAFCQALLD